MYKLGNVTLLSEWCLCHSFWVKLERTLFIKLSWEYPDFTRKRVVHTMDLWRTNQVFSFHSFTFSRKIYFSHDYTNIPTSQYCSPDFDANGDDVKCRWTSENRDECNHDDSDICGKIFYDSRKKRKVAQLNQVSCNRRINYNYERHWTLYVITQIIVKLTW